MSKVKEVKITTRSAIGEEDRGDRSGGGRGAEGWKLGCNEIRESGEGRKRDSRESVCTGRIDG